MGRTKGIVNFNVTQNFLKDTAGDYAAELVKICYKKGKPISDEEIGGKINKLKITEIRTILNRLHYRGIACYDKTKDMKTGWYSYKWEIKTKRIAELILERQEELMEKLEKKKDFEKNYVFFSCEKGCENYPFEIAAEYAFQCPECGNNMNTIDNKKRKRQINKQLKLLKEEMKEIKKVAKALN